MPSPGASIPIGKSQDKRNLVEAQGKNYKTENFKGLKEEVNNCLNKNCGTLSQGRNPSSLHLHPPTGADPVPQLSVPQSCPRRACLQGVLTHMRPQAHRLTEETSSSQREQDQITPEITSWQEARARI